MHGTPPLSSLLTQNGELTLHTYICLVAGRKTSTLSTLLASLYPSLPVALQNPGCKYSFRTIYFDARATMTHDDRDRDRERNRDGVDVKSRSWKYRELGRIDGRDLIRSCGEIEGCVGLSLLLLHSLSFSFPRSLRSPFSLALAFLPLECIAYMAPFSGKQRKNTRRPPIHAR
jgi:hypothetical protein